MKIIGIADFKKLVMERLAKPRDFAGRSLVLWNADYMDYGIAYRVIRQCCIEYDKENPDDQVWFKMSDTMFQNDDYAMPVVLPDQFRDTEVEYGYKRSGILFNTGCYGQLKDQEDWFKFVNTHTNFRGHVFQDCAVIVCAQADQLTCFPSSCDSKDPKWILKEEQFGDNCDIYSIQPTLDEWATWVAPYCHPEILKVVRAYIEKNGIGNEPRGFEYWQRIMVCFDLNYFLEKNKGCSLNQMPRRDVEVAVMSSVSTNPPAPDFCNFIFEYKPID